MKLFQKNIGDYITKVKLESILKEKIFKKSARMHILNL